MAWAVRTGGESEGVRMSYYPPGCEGVPGDGRTAIAYSTWYEQNREELAEQFLEEFGDDTDKSFDDWCWQQFEAME